LFGRLPPKVFLGEVSLRMSEARIGFRDIFPPQKGKKTIFPLCGRKSTEKAIDGRQKCKRKSKLINKNSYRGEAKRNCHTGSRDLNAGHL
jgi:hypothetical protein